MIFLPADNTSATAASETPSKTNGSNQNDSAFAHSATPEAVTPHGSSAAAGPTSSLDSKPAQSRSLGDALGSTFNPATKQEPTQGSSVPIIPTSVDDVKAQLAEANATIARLRKQAEDQGLLRRRNDGSGAKESGTSSGLSTAQVQQAASGVPVQIVAGLCLTCFLLAYFLF